MAKVSIVGLGKLGAPMAAVYASKGHHVIGVDSNQTTINNINNGKTPITETGLQVLMNQHAFTATDSYEEAIKKTDVTFIIVPTPSEANGRFSNRYLLNAAWSIGSALKEKKRYHLVVVCSTTMPGSVNGLVREAIETSSGKPLGTGWGLCYSPEFIALGSVIHDMMHPDMVLIGESDKVAGKKLETIFRTITDAPIRHMSLVNAEIAKISVNTYVTMKISFANTLGEICERVDGGDAFVIANAIGLDSRIGRKYLTPATAFGGPCFPRDTIAFSTMASDLGVRAELAQATRSVNLRQPERIADMAIQFSGGKKNIAVLGLAYKADTPITEESTGMRVAEILVDRGFTVRVYDPSVRPGTTAFTHLNTPQECLAAASVGIITTPWENFKKLAPSCFAEHPGLILIDCWDITEHGPWDDLNVIRLGRSI